MHLFRHHSKAYKIVAKSKLFDKKWYLKTYPDVAAAKMDPVDHYIKFGWREGRNPSSVFNTNSYCEANPDVAAAGINPLVHYETYGKKENRRLLVSVGQVVFPKAAKSKKYVSNKKIKENGKVAIFASYFSAGVIPDYVVYYLEKLHDVVDNIIFIADNPVFDGELDKIKDYCTYAVCNRHGEYDFGSYKRGVLYIHNKHMLDKIDSLILCNDSCFGPINGSFVGMFNKMRKKKCDFWGALDNIAPIPHVQSYFLCFRRSVLQSKIFYHFFASIKKMNTIEEVIQHYEIGLTSALANGGFTYQTYVNSCEIKLPRENKTVYPLYLVKKYAFPLIKIKALSRGWPSTSADNPNKILEYLKKNNERLYENIIAWYESKVTQQDSENYLANKNLIMNSGMWNPKFYKKYNINNCDLLDFYMQVGWQIGHNPSKYFNNDEYLDLYRNVNMCPLLHFITTGSENGRTVLQNLYKLSNTKIREYWNTRLTRKTTKVVYTCLCGNYDDLISHYFIDPTYDYVCFTDNPELIAKKHYGIWEIRPLVYDKLTPALNNRWHKCFPHICLKEYRESIYIDSNINVLSSYLFDIIKTKKKAFLLPDHFGRHSVYDEAKIVKMLKLTNPARVNVMLEKMTREKFPADFGLGENNVLYRQHNNKKLRMIMQDWWRLILTFVERDQLSLMYLFWKYKVTDIKSHFIKNTRQSWKDFRVLQHKTVSKTTNNRKRYLCLFAGYSAKGVMEDYVINYIKNLGNFADVYYFADCKMKKSELDKVSRFVKCAKAERHQMYDFGSWARLFKMFSYENLFQYDYLILANDSCYGPIFPFSDMFQEMERRNVDFWGCTQNNRVKEGTHIQSYFVVLSRDVFTSWVFSNFLEHVKYEKLRKNVVKNYEYGLTNLLSGYGFTYDSYIGSQYLASSDPVDLLKQKCPLLKVKNFTFTGHTVKYCASIKTLVEYLRTNYAYDVNYILKHIDFLDGEYITRLDSENYKFFN